jgi:hypothetical protein
LTGVPCCQTARACFDLLAHAGAVEGGSLRQHVPRSRHGSQRPPARPAGMISTACCPLAPVPWAPSAPQPKPHVKRSTCSRILSVPGPGSGQWLVHAWSPRWVGPQPSEQPASTRVAADPLSRTAARCAACETTGAPETPRSHVVLAASLLPQHAREKASDTAG